MPRDSYIPTIRPNSDLGWRRGPGEQLHYYRHTIWKTLCGRYGLRTEHGVYGRLWPHCKRCVKILGRATFRPPEKEPND